MFRWLKRRRVRQEEQLRALTSSLLGPMALAVALGETIQSYTRQVQRGHTTMPAHRRGTASVIEIWRDLRLEAFSQMYNFGYSNPPVLADLGRPREPLDMFLDEKPHLEMPQPRGTELADTIQGLSRAYQYLGEVGTEVCDQMTDRYALKKSGKSLLHEIEVSARELRENWTSYLAPGAQHSQDLPGTFFQAAFADVTAKTKSVALSAIFGPNHQEGIAHAISVAVEAGASEETARASVDRVLSAMDPDEFFKS